MGLYALPCVGRAGLGNSLFPWARAELFARECGAGILAPRWSSIRIGPYLRREPDKRRYSHFFRADHHCRGLSRALIFSVGHHISETQFRLRSPPCSSSRPCVVEFRGLGDLFLPLAGEHEFIRRQLWQMTAEPLRSTAMPDRAKFIAMHVRRGDLTRQGLSEGDLYSKVTQYTPISWFVGMARAARRAPSLRSLPLIVFTDGSPDELGELPKIEGVHVHSRRPAIADLWTMTRACLLFASGFSTFSMWASFLSGMPTVYAPGKIQQRVQSGRRDPAEIELEEAAEIPAPLLAQVVRQRR
jgi:hypothetical protein